MTPSRRRAALAGAVAVALAVAAAVAWFARHRTGKVVAGDASVQDASSPAGVTLADLARAEDMRQADKVPDEARTSRDLAIRRRAARALARIADVASEAGLLRALGDEDAETAAWGAYGLGFSCKGHEEAFVRALGARAVVVDLSDAGAAAAAPVDLRFAIARAIGRCGGPIAEVLLGGWVRAKGPWRDHAAYALGDVAGRRGRLDDDTVTTLLDAAGDGAIVALYPFGRAEHFNDAFAARLLEVARKTLGSAPSAERVFAVHALGKSGPDAVPDLVRIATTADFSWQERVEALRALGKLGDPGHAAAAEALAKLLPDAKDPMAMLAVSGDLDGALVTALASIGPEMPKSALRVLRDVSSLRPPGEPPAQLARRFAELRCGAASLLSEGVYDSGVIAACDAPGTEASDRARLSALLRRPLVGPRRAAWLALSKSDHLKVREDAIAAIEAHRELGEVGLGVLAAALEDTSHPGVVATAADVLYAHPERAMVLSAKERRNALDPRAPPPSANPEQEVSPAVAKALRAALAFEWSEDLVETRTKLVDAAVALRVAGAREAAKRACGDPNVTVRESAAKALRALGEGAKTACPAPAAMPAAPELGATHGGKLELATDAGNLTIVFDADLAPLVSTRVLDLAKAGFYDGNVIHRVVPGFVVQFGDPQGDGYSGSGKLLRCETSPVPFGPLDVGVALAGRDTGSSQLFVALGRYPRLDGEYARVGHAEGDWYAVAEGDVITRAKVE